MGKRGPAPKPTAIRVLEGNAGKIAINEHEPEPLTGIPSRPVWLSERAEQHWDELVPQLDYMRVLTQADMTALGLLCDALGEWREKRDTNSREAAEAMRRAMSLMGRFGLTPADRTKIAATPKEKPEGLDALRKRSKGA
jgi:phage terminase small subunit